MSYILDALRKAEKDRNLGKTPSLGDVTAPVARPASRKPSTREFVLMGLVVVLLLLAVLLWPRRPAQVASSVGPLTEPAAGASQLAAAKPVTTPEPSPTGHPSQPELNLSASDDDSGAPAADAGEPAVEEGVPAESIDDLLDESGSPDVPVEAASEDENDAAALQAPARKARTPAATTAAPAAPVVPPTAEAPAAEPPAAEPAPAASGEVTLLRDMPSDYRASFPELRIDVHVYDEDPARRWALVNGKKAIEGSTLPEGPTVSAITPDGIVFDYHGQTSLFPLNKR